jgi:hypothetical protein
MVTTPAQPITVREVVRRLIEADRYPCLGNTDWREAERLDEEALALAPTAIASPDDPPEFATWLAALSGPSGRRNRQAVFDEIYDYLEAAEAVGREPFA